MGKILDLKPTSDDQGILGKGGKCNCLKKDKKSRCTLPAGQGTSHPGYGACQYHGGNSPSAIKHAMRQNVRSLAAELDMDPYDALMYTVRLSAGVVAWIRAQINELEALDAPSDDDGKKLRALVGMYGEERDRLAKSAKLAIDAGIDERRIQLEESQGELIAQAVSAILRDLNLTAAQKREAPTIARRHLMALAAGDS